MLCVAIVAYIKQGRILSYGLFDLPFQSGLFSLMAGISTFVIPNAFFGVAPHFEPRGHLCLISSCEGARNRSQYLFGKYAGREMTFLVVRINIILPCPHRGSARLRQSGGAAKTLALHLDLLHRGKVCTCTIGFGAVARSGLPRHGVYPLEPKSRLVMREATTSPWGQHTISSPAKCSIGGG